MTYALDEAGVWWLPNNDGLRVPGWLRFSQANGGELRLIGSLQGSPEDRSNWALSFSEDDGSYARILGEVSGKAVTLDSCFRVRTNSNLASNGLVEEVVNVGVVLVGVHYPFNEVAGGSRLDVTMPEFVFWFRPEALRSAYFNRGSQVRFRVETLRTPSIELAHEGGRLLIQAVTNTGGGSLWRKEIDVGMRVSNLSRSPMDWQGLYQPIVVLRDLVALAVDSNISTHWAELYRTELEDEGDDPPEFQYPIGLHVRWNEPAVSSELTDIPTFKHLIEFEDLGEDGLVRLFAVAQRYSLPLRRLVASRAEREMFVSDRLLNRCAAMEAFDRINHATEDRSFRERMQHSANVAGDVFTRLVGDPEVWSKLLKKRRDDIAHELLATSVSDYDGEIDLILADSVHFLFAFCLMRHAGCPDAMFARIEKQNGRYHWLRNRLASLLALT